MNQTWLSHKKFRRSKKEPEKQQLDEKELDHKGRTELNSQKKFETNNSMIRSQEQHRQSFNNGMVRGVYSQLGNQREVSEVKIAADNTVTRKQVDKQNEQVMKQPKYKNCFGINMQNFPMMRDNIQSSQHSIIYKNPVFVKPNFQNTTDVNRNNFNSPSFPNISNVRKGPKIQTQRLYYNPNSDCQFTNDQQLHDLRNFQTKRSYHNFVNGSTKEFIPPLQTQKQKRNIIKANSSKERLEVEKKETDRGEYFRQNKPETERETLGKRESIKFRIGFLGTPHNRDDINIAKESLRIILKEFLGKYKNSVKLSVTNFSKGFPETNKSKTIPNGISRNSSEKMQISAKVERMKNIPEMVSIHEPVMKNIVNNSFLRNTDSKNMYVNQLRDSVTSVIKQLFQNNPISYNRENIITLLNLQVPLNKELFQKMNLKVKIRVMCMVFTKFVNSKTISQICDNLFDEIDFQDPINLKRILLR